MSQLILPRRLAQQPTRDVIIDPNSPFARGFLCGYVPTNYGRYFGQIEPQAKLAGNPRFVYDARYGLGVRRNDAFSSGLTHSNLLHDRIYGDVTLLAVSRPTTAAASNTSSWLATMSHIGNGATFGIRSSSSDGVNKVYQALISINGSKYIGGSFPVPDDRPIVVAVARNKRDVEQALFINGVKDPLVGNYTGPTIGYTVFGNYNAAPDTETYLMLAWDRALSDEEIASISANPYQLFADRPERLFVADSTVPPGESANPTPSGVYATTSTGILVPSASAEVLVSGVAASAAVGTATVSTGAGVEVIASGVSSTASTGTVTVSADANPAPAGVAAYGQAGSTGSSVDATAPAAGVGAAGAVGVATVSADANPQPEGVASDAEASGGDPLAGAEPDPEGVEARFFIGATMLAGPVYPPPELVAAGFSYGPNGNDFTGTFVGGGGMSEEQDALLRALAMIHGLVPGVPLVVTQTTRSAGDVSQTITESKGTVTIERA